MTESKPSAENHGTVLQVGKYVERNLDGLNVKKGDQIICAMWGVEHFKLEDKDYYTIDCDHPALLASYE